MAEMARGPAREPHVDLTWYTPPHPDHETGPGRAQEWACHPVSAIRLDQKLAVSLLEEMFSSFKSKPQEESRLTLSLLYLHFVLLEVVPGLYLLAHDEPTWVQQRARGGEGRAMPMSGSGHKARLAQGSAM